jgi:hypothetical protein
MLIWKKKQIIRNTERFSVLLVIFETGRLELMLGGTDRVCFAKQDRFEFEEEALEAVQKGRAWGALYFNSNYSDSLKVRLEEARYASELTVDQSNVMVQMDMSSEYAAIHFSPIYADLSTQF